MMSDAIEQLLKVLKILIFLVMHGICKNQIIGGNMRGQSIFKCEHKLQRNRGKLRSVLKQKLINTLSSKESSIQ